MICVKSCVLVILCLQACSHSNLFKHDMIQVCREHVGVFTWSKNIIVAYLVILLFVGRAFAGDYNDVCCVGCSDGLWDVLSPRRALQLAGEVTFCNQKNQLCLCFWQDSNPFLLPSRTLLVE